MDETKLTVRVPRALVEKAKRFAAHNNTTLTSLIEAYLQHIPTQGNLENAPIVQRLSGILPPELSVDDYHQHVEDKYGE
jgi:hypothetical protein